MDDTELHYVTYDPDEIMQEMMVAYLNAGGDLLYAGDEKEMLLLMKIYRLPLLN